MTSRHLAAACAALCLQASFAHAQDADAQARAKRDADNPLRMIIEASKLKPRQKAAEPEAAAKPAPESKFFFAKTQTVLKEKKKLFTEKFKSFRL